MKDIKDIFDRILNDFTLEVGGSHSTLMFSADETMEVLREVLDSNLKSFFL